MSLLSRLFGRAAAKAPEPVLHKDCRIFVAPIKEGSGYRVAARIEKDIDGQVKTHQLVRADTIPSLEEASAITLTKARQAIDQLGDALFG
jgi:hypothetical protein